MTHRNLLLSLAFLSPAICWGATPGFDWEKLTVEVKPLSDAFLLAEPVTLEVSLTNEGEATVVLPTSDLNIDNETIGVAIARGEEAPVEYSGWFVAEPSAASFALQSGARVSFIQTLHWLPALNRLAFPAVGRYRVTVQVFNPTAAENAISAPTEVTIIDPPDADRVNWDLLSSKPVALFLKGISEPDQGLLERVNRSLEARPDSRYAPYLLEAKSRYLGRTHFERPADTLESQRILEAGLERTQPGHPFRVPLLITSARLQLSLGETDRQVRLVREIEKVATDDLALAALRRRLVSKSR